MLRRLLSLSLVLLVTPAASQTRHPDKCGYDEQAAKALLNTLGPHWGYGYADLLADLATWRESPYVTVDSLGASVQKRALWQLTITAPDTSVAQRRTVYVHARTHPAEVQGWWVTRELINLLLSETDLGRFLRRQCVFHILPMLNPDGVELEIPRRNANGVDLESNWFSNNIQPEVVVLRERFQKLMASDAPIEVALNMHSALACKRYFVYHDAAGTSEAYAVLEQSFIEGVRAYFAEGIEPWYYFVSWTNGTPLRYPESWFWIHHGESVMALTYEDMNCQEAGEFTRTAEALLRGIADYLGLVTAVAGRPMPPRAFTLLPNYPNPFNPGTTLAFELSHSADVELAVHDELGRRVVMLRKGRVSAGRHRVRWDGRDSGGNAVASGVYFYRLRVGQQTQSRRLTLVR